MITALLLSITSTAAAAGECSAPNAMPVETNFKEALRMPRMGGMLRGLRASIGQERLDVDEHVTDVTLVGDAPKQTTITLALPPPWLGFIDLRPRVDAHTCAAARRVRVDGKLVRLEIERFPIVARVNASRRGAKGGVDFTIAPDRVRLAPPWLHLDVEGKETFSFLVGEGVPDAAALGTQGALEYLRALERIHAEIANDLHASRDPQAQALVLLELAARLRDLSTWMPAQRLEAARKLDALTVPKPHRPLQRYWRSRLGPSPPESDKSARLLIDDAVLELWVDGRKVYDEKEGSPRSVGIPVGEQATQFWIVARDPLDPKATTVHDTTAVLRAGVVYGVTRTYVALAGGGARRECVRVEGALPSGKRLAWRELGSLPGPMLGIEDAYRPPFDVAERAVSIVSPEKNAEPPFPPAPLVYSYTHPGTYRWTVGADGTVKLDLIDDDKLCPTEPKEPLVHP